MAKWKCIAWIMLLLLLTSCAPSRAQRRPYLIAENMDNAARHMERGEKEEAAQIYQTVLLADPSNEEAQAQLGEIADYDRSIVQPSLLGSNLVRAPKRESQTLWLAMYLVNRVLNLLDVVSFHV